jgi:hypothetical protein
MFDRDKILKALTELRDAAVAELDMDAVSPRLGQAVNHAEEVIDKATEVRRADAFLDQSKW